MLKQRIKQLTTTLKYSVSALVILICPQPAFATAPNSPEILHQETQHLLNYVSSTSCQYERNGTFHTGIEAKKHILKKYRYFQENITTTEKFIKYAATKSKMSGQYYYIHCPKQTKIKSRDWLLTELRQYRSLSR